MRRAFIVAPNVGLSFGNGGGVKVAIYMAWTLLKHGFKVHLIALYGWDVDSLAKVHGVDIVKFFRRGKLILNYMFGTRMNSLKVPFPLGIKLVSMYIGQLARKYYPDVIIFHDDVPKLNEKTLKRVSKLVLYSHFPYVVRSHFNIVDAVKVGLEKYQSYRTRLYYSALKKVLYFENMPEEIELVANSTITRTFMEILWRRRVKVLYPPVTLQSKSIDKPKDDLIVLVGGQPNKRIEDAIEALAELKNERKHVPRLYIVAYTFVPWYKRWLLNLIYKYGLQQYVYFMESLPESELIDAYTSAKVILSTAHFEPFGMSVAEGMLFRAIPIVYKSILSGPWMDVVDRGRYGIGFRSITELAEAIDYVLSVDKKEFIKLQERAFVGTCRFLIDEFEKSFLRIIRDS